MIRDTAPETLRLTDVHRLDAVRARLCHALRTADTLAGLRAYVADLAADLEGPHEDAAPDTIRTPGAPWDGDAAPPTPRASLLGEEYGV